ncbi:vitamin K-dependent gamma-carboxylase [Malaya genurostris]|uniref:vitamin K-dependent gamma-carboxylase n=1 Tax=Malaya genurostris TaxID=325434 RepID=UPI0026F39DE2|nr:vitamin K-dependent gamma-carboxylase [Malaya genurostris]
MLVSVRQWCYEWDIVHRSAYHLLSMGPVSPVNEPLIEELNQSAAIMHGKYEPKIAFPTRLKINVSRLLLKYCGHDSKCLHSFDQFIALMYRPTDAAALGVARLMFGLMMLIDIPEERGGGSLDYRWGDPKGCTFPLIDGIEPMTFPRMGIVYLMMWLGSLGIMLGYRFRLTALMFVTTYWYVFLLDKSAWNNHSYLYGLLGTLFLFTDANRFLSLDAYRNRTTQPVVPFWNYFILKYQFFILYFLAGMKKMSTEWLSGYAMTNLGYHWVFLPFRIIIGVKLTDLLIIHWFGCIFDTLVVFFLIYAPTRKIATMFACAFHLMNSRLFHIGMFPWTCLTQLPLYYSVSWPRLVLKRLPFQNPPKLPNNSRNQTVTNVRLVGKSSKRQKFVVSTMLIYCGLQLFLPYSHFITKGYNNWTNGLYGYSWDMMVHAWDTVLTSIKIVDNLSNQTLYLQSYAFVDNDRWTKHADMAHQFARCIDRYIREEYRSEKRPFTNFSIYFDIWCSLNGRFLQRIFHPEVDVLNAEWSPFEPADWLLPLLHEFTGMRAMITDLTKEVHSWSNNSDVLFVADFPGFTLDNYIVPEMDNVTLTVLEGSVAYRYSNNTESFYLSKGQYLNGIPSSFHHVKTTSHTPSSLMYTYVNKSINIAPSEEKLTEKRQSKPILPLWQELSHRLENYVRFLQHVGNSILYEIYGVPMPRRIRITPDEEDWMHE